MAKKVFPVCRVPGDYEASDWPGTDFSGDPGLTDQSGAKDCDINVILDRFTKTGVLPNTDREIYQGDFSSVPTYEESLNIVIKAQAQFDGLDAHVRKRFGNDPSEFLAFCHDEKNLPEMAKLGLLTPEAAARVLAPPGAAQAPPAPAPTSEVKK